MKFTTRPLLLRRSLFPLLVAVAIAPLPAADRPNILWLVSEDNTSTFTGPYGDPLARTPAIDRLAGTGVVFTHAHSPAPVCAPTRSSIITGVYASSLGTQHMRSEHPLPPEVKFFPEFLRAAGYFTTNRAKTDYNTSTPHAIAWDENGGSAHWRHRAAAQPFFSVFNFDESHESRLHTRQLLTTDPAKVRVPAYLPDNPETRANLAQYYDCVSRADGQIGRILKELADDGLADDTIVFYYSDNGGVLPRSKRFLFDNGTHVALVVYFPPKFRHLAPAGPGCRIGDMVNLVDLAPTILNLAGLPIPGYMQGRAFAGPNLGAAPASTLTLRDRMDERYDLTRAVANNRFRYIRNYRPDLTNGRKIAYLWRQASMHEWARLHAAGRLDATQRAFFEPKPAEQLFDCIADPDNIRDLAGDPAYREQLVALRAELRASLLKIQDAGFLPESLMVELAAGGTPTRVSRDEAVYPLAELIDAIDALQLGPPAPGKIAGMLKHSLPVFRYWGVIAAMNDRDTAVSALLDDPNPTVRLAAAEAVIGTLSPTDPAAWREVTAALSPANTAPLRLAAANIVADSPAFTPASLAALQGLPGLAERNFKEYYLNLLDLIASMP